MRYSKEYLSDLAEKVIHAYEHDQNVYHDIVNEAIYFLMMSFNLSEKEVINKIKEELL